MAWDCRQCPLGIRVRSKIRQQLDNMYFSIDKILEAGTNKKREDATSLYNVGATPLCIQRESKKKPSKSWWILKTNIYGNCCTDKLSSRPSLIHNKGCTTQFPQRAQKLFCRVQGPKLPCFCTRTKYISYERNNINQQNV